ncbi:hypothetical protein Bca4012_020467 [Brassica carinata]
MVAKAKPSQSSVGRRPRSTAEKVAKSPPAKQWWYPANCFVHLRSCELCLCMSSHRSFCTYFMT